MNYEFLMKIIDIDIFLSKYAQSTKCRLLGGHIFANFRIVNKTILNHESGLILIKLTLISHVDFAFVAYKLQNYLQSIFEPECKISLVSEHQIY